ncbi:S8 family serine peptidase [Microbulbifer sp. THAF38]|uniref:S8 family serine peptidase n=1 Tax=Microbulbifer sp. THAF38 TaxID=2587856 RepID=UPI0012689949|nr:S8 family serine peptidase [Microbulbifer sp. THAF38]QFT53070.1 Extracellular basic protease precursor [Microbulbifer sp. THAF38]
MMSKLLKLTVSVAALMAAACSGGGGGGDGEAGGSGTAVSVANQAPVASFTLSSQSGLSPAVVKFDASTSSDTDGSITKYEWNFDDGEGSDASGKDVEYTFYAYDEVDKEYTIQLTVTDDDGATATSEMTFIALKNLPPVAKFTYNQPDPKSRLVLFDASESTDSESTDLLYKWDFGDGTTGEGIQPEHEYQEYGNYSVSLIVDDQTGNTSKHVSNLLVSDGLFSAFGQLSLAQGVFADSDTSDPNTEDVPNNSMKEAQVISEISEISGLVSSPKRNSSGVELDRYDFYVATLKKDQEILLHMQEWENGSADIDLYLINESGYLIADSSGTSDTETLRVPEDGMYYLAAYAYAGTSAYRLRVFSSPTIDRSSNSIRTSDNFVAGQLLARLKPEAKTSDMQMLASLGAIKRSTGTDRPLLLDANQAAIGFGGAKPDAAVLHLNSAGVQVSADKQRKLETIHALKRLHASGKFEYVELNRIRQRQSVNDPLYPNMWHYPQISLSGAWRTSTGAGSIVAVLDTGILSAHPDMQDQLVAGYDMISDTGMALDGDGIDPNPEDPGDAPDGTHDSWHGTHVAGTIAAATNNAIGIAGVAYDAKIMPVRVLGYGGGSDYDIAQGIYFAAGLANDSGTVPERKADVINMSLGGSGHSQAMQDAVSAARAAGVIVVVAAGNSSDDASNYSPASLDGVITVAATRQGGDPAGYTNYGLNVDLTAPGGDTFADGGVISTIGNEIGSGEIEFIYGGMQGTSMATPHVAGVVALMKEAWKSMTPDDFDELVSDFRVSYGVTPSNLYGYGQIDAELAVASAKARATGTLQAGRLFVENGHQRELWTKKELEVELLADQPGVSVAEIISSEPWMSVTYLGEESNGLGSYRIAVDSSNLSVGRYSGILSFTASTETRFDLRVSVQIIDKEVDSSDYAGAIYVEFINLETGEAVDRVTATFDSELGVYHYKSSPLDATSEYGFGVMAGTDVDNDGIICEVDELCHRLESGDGWIPIVSGYFHEDVEVMNLELRALDSPLDNL